MVHLRRHGEEVHEKALFHSDSRKISDQQPACHYIGVSVEEETIYDGQKKYI